MYLPFIYGFQTAASPVQSSGSGQGSSGGGVSFSLT